MNVTCKDKIDIGLRGDTKIVSYDKNTGQVLEIREDHNIVVLQSREIIIKLIYEGLSDYYVNIVKLGDDVGSGTTDSPEPPDETYTITNLSEIYEISGTENININYANALSTAYSIFVNGENVMQEYPSQDNVIMTSMALVTPNDSVFAYRRFEGLTITENININITWNLYYAEQ